MTAPLLFAHTLILNSRFSLDVVCRAIPRLRRRSRIVYNGVPGPEQLVPPREVVAQPFRVLYLGRLSPRKGPHVAIDAVARVNDEGVPTELVLLGAVFEGYEWYEHQLRAQVAAHGLTDAIEFAGFQPRIWSFVADADVVVVPSVMDEPFGNTAVEAVLGGRPVVASDTSGLREAAGPYASAVLVPRDDSEALAAALTRIRSEWTRFSAAAPASAQAAADRHAPAVYRSDVARVLDEVVASRRLPLAESGSESVGSPRAPE